MKSKITLFDATFISLIIFNSKLMNTKSIFILIFLFVANLCFAQNDNQDVIYTNNGSIFRGNIVKMDENRSIDLQIKNGQVIHFDHSEIQKIVQEATVVGIGEKTYNFKEHGMFYASSFEPNFGLSAWNRSIVGVGLHQVVGYQMNRWLGYGLGLGVDGYEIGSGRLFVPLYLQVRGYFTKNRISPYYSVNIGYGFAEDTHDNSKEIDGGRYFYPSVGYRFGAAKSGNFTMDFGIKFQKGHFLRVNNWGSDDRNVDYRRFTFRLGWLF